MGSGSMNQRAVNSEEAGRQSGRQSGRDALRRGATKKGDWAVAEIVERVIDHPKTSAAGLLLALTTVLGVLQQQGISLGHAGTGTVVTLMSALATALLGLMAKD